jgi:hypothetical protein
MSAVRTIPVIFRKSAGEVVAVFPTEPCNDRGDLTVYARIGQHSGASWSWYRSTKKATAEEFLPLLLELRQIYESERDCLLQHCDRVTQGHKKTFYAAMRRARKN